MALALSAQIGGRGGIGFNPGGPMQPNVNQAPPATDCAASGTVVNAITGEPIARAMVSLSGPSNGGAATDSNGQWSVTNQTCGFINPTTTHPGFITGFYGQQSGQSGPRRVELVSGSPVRDLKLTLMPEGTISGRVQDENGDPVEGAAITVARMAVMNGERAMINGGGGAGSDSQGNFRTDRLQPGRYVVCAQSSGRVFPIGGGEPMVYTGDCYPGPIASGPSVAAPLEGGRELRVGLTLRSTAGLHVRGTVSGLPAGQRATVNLTNVITQGRGGGLVGMMGGASMRGFTAPDGTFDITGVISGSYVARVQVQNQSGPPGLFAGQEVSVGSSDVNNLHLALQPLGSVTGTVHVVLTNPASDKPAASKPNININISPETPGMGGTGGPAQWDADHLNFTFAIVQPGRYVINANLPGNNGTYVKSATLNGQDVLNQPFTVNGATGPIEIVVSDDSGTFTANVTDANDQPISAMIILKPSSGQTITLGTDDGKATRDGLPVGQYHAWAFDDIRNVPYNEDEWMTQHAGPATAVTISASGSANVTIKRVNAPAEP
jgi:hypothetical protein